MQLGGHARHADAASQAAAVRQLSTQQGCKQPFAVRSLEPACSMMSMPFLASLDSGSLPGRAFPACPAQVFYRRPIPGVVQARPTTTTTWRAHQVQHIPSYLEAAEEHIWGPASCGALRCRRLAHGPAQTVAAVAAVAFRARRARAWVSQQLRGTRPIRILSVSYAVCRMFLHGWESVRTAMLECYILVIRVL